MKLRGLSVDRAGVVPDRQRLDTDFLRPSAMSLLPDRQLWGAHFGEF
jgi:hypothetical protein